MVWQLSFLLVSAYVSADRPAFIAAKLPSSGNAPQNSRAADDAERSSSAHIRGPPIVPTRDYVPAALQNYQPVTRRAASNYNSPEQTSAYHSGAGQYSFDARNQQARWTGDTQQPTDTRSIPRSSMEQRRSADTGGTRNEHTEARYTDSRRAPFSRQASADDFGQPPRNAPHSADQPPYLRTPSYDNLANSNTQQQPQSSSATDWGNWGASSPMLPGQISGYQSAGPTYGHQVTNSVPFFGGAQNPDYASGWTWGQLRRLQADEDPILKILEDMILHGDTTFRIV